MANCYLCNKTYNQKTTDIIIASLTFKLPLDTTNLCLDCIKESLNKAKQAKTARLKELKQSLDEAKAFYYEIGSEWQAAAKEYQDLDYQAAIIGHKQKPTIIKPKTPKTKSNKSNKSKKTKSKASLAMQALAELSPEMQRAIIENLKKLPEAQTQN